jgi:predicted nuclease of predicted toxin-antitoxin system
VRFLIDANLPRSMVELIASLGHEVEFARDVGLSAASDSEVAAHAQTTQAAIITRDLDFADVRNFPPERYAGIVVLRVPEDMVAKDIVHIAEMFLREPMFLMHLFGRLAIVEPDRVRFRPALT